MDNADRRRFLTYLSVLNSTNQIVNLSEKLARNEIEVSPQSERLVHIVAYCLMNNHFHILLVQAKDRGIEKFMQKLGTGYTMYFNKRYERVGSLFQGVFKSIPVENDAYLFYLPHYIHANPLDFSHPEWRQSTIQNNTRALENIENYPWSSYSYYTGRTNNLIIDPKTVVNLFGNKKLIVDQMKDWLQNKNSRDNLVSTGLTLE